MNEADFAKIMQLKTGMDNRSIPRGEIMDAYLETFEPVDGSPWGWESRKGLRMIPWDRDEQVDVIDKANIPGVFVQILGTAGKAGSSTQLSTNRFTLSPGIHKNFTLVIDIPKQTYNNVMFNSGYTLLDSYMYTADDQQVIYRFSGAELHNLMYGLSYEGSESERIMSAIMYQGFTRPSVYAPHPHVFDDSSAETEYRMNPLSRSPITLFLDLPTPWHGPDALNMDDFNDGLIETSKPIYHSMEFVIADYNRSILTDPYDITFGSGVPGFPNSMELVSDRSRVGQMSFQLWDYYYPKTNITAEAISEAEKENAPQVPSFNIQRVRETKTVESGTVVEIATELQKYAGRTFALMFWVADTFQQDIRLNQLTRYLEMGRVNLDIASYTAITFTNPKKEFMELVSRATGGRQLAGITEENIGIIPFNPTLSTKVYGGVLDTLKDVPILRVQVTNEASTLRTLEQTTFLIQYAFYTRSGANDAFEFYGQ